MPEIRTSLIVFQNLGHGPLLQKEKGPPLQRAFFLTHFAPAMAGFWWHGMIQGSNGLPAGPFTGSWFGYFGLAATLPDRLVQIDDRVIEITVLICVDVCNNLVIDGRRV